jgi:tetratricopeptide (TPR) repeat protein
VFRTSLSALLVSTALAVIPVQPLLAEGLAGAYLAARSASMNYDFDAAASYFTRALIQDPANVELMQSAILSHIGTGDVERAVPIARRLNDLNHEDQVANLIVLSEAVASGDFAAAAKMLDNGDSVGPLVDGLVQAWLQFGEGRMSEAVAAFDEVSKSPGLQNFGLYHKALALAAAGDMEGADEIMSGRSGVTLPATRRSVLAHAQILSQLERNADAVELIDAVFQGNLDPGMEIARQRLSDGETLSFDVILGAKEGIAEVYFSIAGALVGEADDAYTLLYTRMSEFLNPKLVDATLMSAQLLERLGRYDLATETYNRISPDDPVYHEAEMGRAEALKSSGQTDEAIEVLSRLSQSHPDQPSIFVSLGDMLRSEERYEEATAAYDAAVALIDEPNPRQWPVFFARGITFERTDKWPQAEADFRKALELSPDQPQVLNYLGYSFVEMKQNLDEALDMIQRAVAARPDDGYITDSLGWVFYRLGRYDEATTVMERAAELTPVDPIVTDHLGDVYWAVGRRREAEFQWHRALSFEPEEVDAARIRRKLEVGLDVVLDEEGGDPISRSNDG